MAEHFSASIPSSISNGRDVFDGGKITFRLDVSKGVIKNASVFGDFFSTLDAETICSALIGCRYEKGDVLRALLSNGIDGAVYRISAEDMAKKQS